MSALVLDHVLDQYAIDWRSGRVESLGGGGGFSGAQFWRLTVSGQLLCLRRWPTPHPNRKKLAEIHDLLQRAGNEGLSYLPVPWKTRHRGTMVEAFGNLWELSRWMPGKADYENNPSPRRLAASLRSLAEFHQAAMASGGVIGPAEVSPGVLFRQRRLHRLVHGGADRIATAAAANRRWQPGVQIARHLVAAFWQSASRVAPVIDQAAVTRVPLQPCIRDVWHDHVLLTGDEVTGLIDFGAVGHDTVAGDIARLLGSMVRDEAAGWQEGLRAYESIRSLTSQERVLVLAFDRANVVLSGMQWLQWIHVEGKQFENQDRILLRLEQILARIESMLGRSTRNR